MRVPPPLPLLALALLPLAGALVLPGDGDDNGENPVLVLTATSMPWRGLEHLRGGEGPLARFRRKPEPFEFSDQDNTAFLSAAQLMRHVSMGFYVHAIVEGILIMRELAHGGGAWLSLFDVMDEWTYAFLIRGCAKCMHDIATTSGSDIQTLLTSIGMQNRLWHHMRVPLAIKTLILAASLLSALLPEHAASLQRAAEGPLGAVARAVAPPVEAGLAAAGRALGSARGILQRAGEAARGKVRRMRGEPCGVGIVVEAGVEGLQVAAVSRAAKVLGTQSFKAGWDPRGVRVGDIVLAVGEEFMNGRVASYVEGRLVGPEGSAVEVRFMRKHQDRSQGGQFILKLQRGV